MRFGDCVGVFKLQSIHLGGGHCVESSSKFFFVPFSRHFFEMVRFDFILDSKMRLYLLEANMSPNLSTGHFPQNKVLYEETLFGMLNVVGISRSVPNDLGSA